MNPEELATNTIIAQELLPFFKRSEPGGEPGYVKPPKLSADGAPAEAESTTSEYAKYLLPALMGGGGAVAGGVGAYLSADEKNQRERRMRVLLGTLLGGGAGAGLGYAVGQIPTDVAAMSESDSREYGQPPIAGSIADKIWNTSRDLVGRARRSPALRSLGLGGLAAGELVGIGGQSRRAGMPTGWAGKRSLGRELGELGSRVTGGPMRWTRKAMHAPDMSSVIEPYTTNVVARINRARVARNLPQLNPGQVRTLRDTVSRVFDAPTRAARAQALKEVAIGMGHTRVLQARPTTRFGRAVADSADWLARGRWGRGQRAARGVLSTMDESSPLWPSVRKQLGRARMTGSGLLSTALGGAAYAAGMVPSSIPVPSQDAVAADFDPIDPYQM